MFNAKLKIISAYLLLVLGFVFFHSELGQCGQDSSNYFADDYCLIIKGANIQSTNSTAIDLLKLKFEKSICSHCFEKLNEQISSYIKLDLEQFHAQQHSAEVYIINRSLLI